MANNNAFRFNPHKLRKKDLVELMENYCKHGHTYMEHPKCYYDEAPDLSFKEKLGFLDIESSNIHAPFGFMLSWCIKDDGGKIAGDHVKAEDFERERNSMLETPVRVDENILKSLSAEMDKYDKLAVYWGKNRRHDIPFIRHRCIKLNIPFPLYGTVYCVDVFDWVRNMLKQPYGGNSLWSACTEMDIPAKGTRCPRSYWSKAKTGNMKAVKVIYEHNKDDVVCLEPLYHMLEPYARKQRTSV